ncbi:DUF317 domain-containing protein [Streptomyces sp. NPDC051172]|uniref:DUF317 domain-containing protein n=1 Tax=Streptomyces sp. NPDC051172 TaxID=3155796 RepID=UPI00344711A2
MRTVQHTRVDEQPARCATFGARTPFEIITAFTDALTDPAKPMGIDHFEPLRKAGWHSPSIDNALVSPDGIVRIDRAAHGSTSTWAIRTALSWQPARAARRPRGEAARAPGPVGRGPSPARGHRPAMGEGVPALLEWSGDRRHVRRDTIASSLCIRMRYDCS